MRTRTAKEMEVVPEADCDESLLYSVDKAVSSTEKPPKTVRFETHQNESGVRKSQIGAAKMSKMAVRSAKEFIESKVKMSQSKRDRSAQRPEKPTRPASSSSRTCPRARPSVALCSAPSRA